MVSPSEGKLNRSSLPKLCSAFSAHSLKHLLRVLQNPNVTKEADSLIIKTLASLKKDRNAGPRRVRSEAVKVQIAHMLSLDDDLISLATQALIDPQCIETSSWKLRLQKYHDPSLPIVSEDIQCRNERPENTLSQREKDNWRQILSNLSPLPPPPQPLSKKPSNATRHWMRLFFEASQSDKSSTNSNLTHETKTSEKPHNNKHNSSSEDIGIANKLDDDHHVDDDDAAQHLPSSSVPDASTYSSDDSNSDFELVMEPYNDVTEVSKPENTSIFTQISPHLAETTLSEITKELNRSLNTPKTAVTTTTSSTTSSQKSTDNNKINCTNTRKFMTPELSNETAKSLKRRKKSFHECQASSSSSSSSSSSVKPKFSRVAQQFREPCKFWMNKLCSLGKECSFAHDGIPTGKKELCKYFRMGVCEKSSDCPYSHDWPCKFFHLYGGCTKTQCEFHHRPISDAQLFDLKNQVRDQARKKIIDAGLTMSASGGDVVKPDVLPENPFRSLFGNGSKSCR